VKSALARRIVWAIMIGLMLIVVAVGVLLFADATAIPRSEEMRTEHLAKSVAEISRLRDDRA
jgi:hypothetical protein